MNYIVDFLSFFRGIFLFHSGSLEFRAKVYAAILIPEGKISQKNYKLLKELAYEIYPKQKLRANLLVSIVNEYVVKSSTYKNLSLDRLLKEIDYDLKHHKKYTKKINFEHLRRLMSVDSFGYALVQQRVYEFLIQEVEIYS